MNTDYIKIKQVITSQFPCGSGDGYGYGGGAVMHIGYECFDKDKTITLIFGEAQGSHELAEKIKQLIEKHISG